MFAVHEAGRRARFLAKNDLFEVPVVGRALKGAGQIPVSRGSGDQTPLVEAREALERGEVVVIYPEGTVTDDPDSMPMKGKTGVIRLSLDSGVPITPIASWGSQAVWQKSGRGSVKFGRPVWVRAGPAIDFSARADEKADREALREMTAELMSALTGMVKDLRSRYPKRWTEVG